MAMRPMEVAVPEAKPQQQMGPFLAPLFGLAQAVTLVFVGGAGILLHWSPAGLPHLFLGILVAGVLLSLLVLGIIKKRLAVAALALEGEKQQGSQYQRRIWPPPWAQSGAAVCELLQAGGGGGLEDEEAAERLKMYGSNVVEFASVPGYWSFFSKEIYEPTQLLLLSVGVLYIMFGSLEEGATAFAVIFLMAAAEVWTEWRAKTALSKLEFSAPTTALVKRQGCFRSLPSAELVPGDIIALKAGMEVAADARLLHCEFLEVDESKMSGESSFVLKKSDCILPAEASMFAWANVVLAGSFVHRGTGTAVVFETGPRTHLGQVLALAGKSKEKKTKLQKHLKELAWVLSMVALVASVFGALLGIIKHMRWQDVILSALSLAFATIPEELPILIAAVLAVGGRMLSLRNVYVKQLRAAENLGYVNVILTDKTGTLTENALVLTDTFTPGLPAFEAGAVASEIGKVPTVGRDIWGTEKLLEAWLFMVDMAQLDFASMEADSPPVSSDGDLAIDIDDSGLLMNEIVSGPRGSDEDFDGRHSLDVFDQAVLKAVGVSNLKDYEQPAAALETAKLHHMKQHLQNLCNLKANANLIAQIPFDSEWKFAAKTFQSKSTSARETVDAASSAHSGETIMFVKGAPEILLQQCASVYDDQAVVPVENVRRKVQEQIVAAATKGFRLIGYASQSSMIQNELKGKSPESEHLSQIKGCTFLGFMAFEDPVRKGAVESVAECHQAGVRVIMVTGDHMETALAVALNVGIAHDQTSFHYCISCTDVSLSGLDKEGLNDMVERTNIYARATPADKLIILKTLQASGNCVMAAGDGLNDAAILAKADVGMAMGKGTDVARKAASIVVVDDNFAIMPFALAEGRRLLDNLRKALAFYLGAKLGLLFLFIAGTLWKSFPLQAIHIIVLELFMDLGASSSFVLESPDEDIMKRNPRRQSESFFDKELITCISVAATSMIFCVFGSFTLGVYNGQGTAQTCAFVAWLLAHVLLAFNMRTVQEPVTHKGWLRNRGMCLWLVAAVGLAILIITQSRTRLHLKLVQLPVSLWLLVILICIVGTFWIEIIKLVVGHTARGKDGYSRLTQA